MDNLTILEAVGELLLCKQIECVDGAFQSRKTDYPLSFNVTSTEVENLRALADVLQELETDPTKAVIRGSLKEGFDRRNIPRRTRSALDPFESASRQWLCIDIDELPFPEGLEDFNDAPEDVARYAAEQLPEAFQGVDFFWQFSGSMGVKPGIRVHLWFWLINPITDFEAKAWLSDAPTQFDLSLYQPIQLHFTAAPIFEPTESNPVRLRSGLYEYGDGVAEVIVPPDISERAEAFQQTRRQKNPTADGTRLEDYRIVRDEDDRVIDGRELFLFYKSLDACAELCAGRNLARDLPTIEEITERTWGLFEAEVDLSDGLWTIEDARDKAAYRHRDFMDGWKPVGRNQTTALVPDVEPYFEINPMPIGQADDLLGGHLDSFFRSVRDNNPKKMALRVTMGAGKTTRTITKLKQLLRENPALHVHIYLPTHDLIEEQLENLQDVPGGIQVVHMRGRGNEDEDGNTLCQRYGYVQSLEEAGISVRPNACYRPEHERCQHYEECGYWDQFRREGDGSIRLFPHAYLAINKTDRIPEPDIVIIDEAFLSALHQKLTIRSEDLRTAFVGTDIPDLGNRIADWLRDGEALLSRLRESGITSDWLRGLDFRVGRDGPMFQARSNQPGRFEGARERTIRGFEALCEVLAEEIELGEHDHEEKLRYDPNRHEIVIDRLITNEIPDADHLLVLDATADHSILTKLFPVIEFHQVDFEQRAIVTQVFDRTGSNMSWNGGEDNVDDLIRLLQEQTRIGDQVLCVSHKALADRLRGMGLGDGIGIEHFGNLRGIDAYRNYNTVFVTGRNQPPQADIDGLARALWWDDEEPLNHDQAGLLGAAPAENLPVELRGYLTTDPEQTAGVFVRSFSDSRIEAVHQQMREAETVQAIARLRLVHARNLKHVYLLGNLPIEMPINRLVEWNELMLNRAERELIDRGNIPLTPMGWLRMRPDIVGTENEARNLNKRNNLNAPQDLLMATPLLLRLGLEKIEFRQLIDGQPFGRTQAHLFRPVVEVDRNELGVTMLANLPIAVWQAYLERGDNDIPNSGWGPIEITNIASLDNPSDLLRN